MSNIKPAQKHKSETKNQNQAKRVEMGLAMTGKNLQDLNYLNEEVSRDSENYDEDQDLEEDDNLESIVPDEIMGQNIDPEEEEDNLTNQIELLNQL
jgi:hypothetical protein